MLLVRLPAFSLRAQPQPSGPGTWGTPKPGWGGLLVPPYLPLHLQLLPSSFLRALGPVTPRSPWHSAPRARAFTLLPSRGLSLFLCPALPSMCPPSPLAPAVPCPWAWYRGTGISQVTLCPRLFSAAPGFVPAAPGPARGFVPSSVGASARRGSCPVPLPWGRCWAMEGVPAPAVAIPPWGSSSCGPPPPHTPCCCARRQAAFRFYLRNK